MSEKKLKFLEIITGIILVGAIILICTVMSQVFTKGYVTLNGYSMFKVATGSMEPTIEVGALLICESTPIENVQFDDIICFESTNGSMRGEVITHRVVDIQLINNVLRLTTRGDANVVEDAFYVTEHNFIGKVVWYSGSESLISQIVMFMGGKLGFLACIVFPVLLICGLIMRESLGNIQADIKNLKQLEIETAQRRQQELIELVKKEQEEELKARLRAEIRKELGLDEEGEGEYSKDN